VKNTLTRVVLSAAASLILLQPSAAHAYPSAAWDVYLQTTESLLASPATTRYQIGDEWGKKFVKADELDKESAAFARAAKATAQYGGGTAFYLGKFNGHHLAGTNHHVQPHLRCQGPLYFTAISVTATCKKILGHLPEVDFALIELTLTASQELKLAAVGRNFAYDRPILQGMPLITVGFGVADNPSRRMVGNQDSDCKVFSADNDFKKMADPDELNPGDYEAWSFANGCDVSHGDSGSAMVDRDSGDPIGIIWTGRIPKNPDIQNSKTLDDLLRTQSPRIWKELSYAVPAAKIREVLRRVLTEDQTLEPSTREAIEGLIR
jgi:hypothetical protein